MRVQSPGNLPFVGGRPPRGAHSRRQCAGILALLADQRADQTASVNERIGRLEHERIASLKMDRERIRSALNGARRQQAKVHDQPGFDRTLCCNHAREND
jgi:hypothetical protein